MLCQKEGKAPSHSSRTLYLLFAVFVSAHFMASFGTTEETKSFLFAFPILLSHFLSFLDIRLLFTRDSPTLKSMIGKLTRASDKNCQMRKRVVIGKRYAIDEKERMGRLQRVSIYLKANDTRGITLWRREDNGDF